MLNSSCCLPPCDVPSMLSKQLSRYGKDLNHEPNNYIIPYYSVIAGGLTYMQFCPKCKSMMFPAGNIYKCRRCGTETPKGNKDFSTTTEHKERGITILEGEESAGLPTTRVKCEECGNDTAYWWLRQLRSADESETRFFRCTKCGKTWREYD